MTHVWDIKKLLWTVRSSVHPSVGEYLNIRGWKEIKKGKPRREENYYAVVSFTCFKLDDHFDTLCAPAVKPLHEVILLSYGTGTCGLMERCSTNIIHFFSVSFRLFQFQRVDLQSTFMCSFMSAKLLEHILWRQGNMKLFPEQQKIINGVPSKPRPMSTVAIMSFNMCLCITYILYALIL